MIISMSNFAVIIICLIAGILLARFKVVGEQGVKGVNAWVFYVALPALSLRYVPEMEWSREMLFPALSPIVMLAGAWCFVRLMDILRLRFKGGRFDIGTRTALFVTIALSNTGFIGIPMTAAFFGESNVQYAVLNDQITFLLFSTVALVAIMRAASIQQSANAINTSAAAAGTALQNTATATQNPRISLAAIIKKTTTFPPFIAFITALILPYFVDISIANPVLDKLMVTMSPMAVFSIGLQLRLGALSENRGLVTAGLIYKLLLAPLLILGFALLFGAKDNGAQVSIFEASMSSHITVSLLASQYGLNPRLCSLIVGAGIIAGFITSSLWAMVLK
ncbi:MAG: AEC family transporter [Bacteroidales bacterium]|jgi:predicted permease|nr:AEC family transporter [Bacteroidales bacterium]